MNVIDCCVKNMFPFTIRMLIQTLFFVFLLSLTHGQDRQIISKLNPGCDTCNKSNILVYTKADSTHDSIHQIWDFTRGIPTIIFVVTNLSTSLTIDWIDKVPISFKLSEKPYYSFAAAIDSLYEYDDCLERGHIDYQCPKTEISLRFASWRLKDSILTDKEAMIHMHGVYKDYDRTGVIDMRLDLLPFYDYAIDLPHLIHTSNSTLIGISLVNFTTTYNASRYAVHFTLTSTDRWNDSMNYTMRKSLDDEHTPGVFEMMEIKTPKCITSAAGGFMQFRPVGYTEEERSVSSSTNAYVSNFNRTKLRDGTLKIFYRDFDPDFMLVQSMFISFGLPGDGYYKQHNYTSWSYTFGYGTPPVESVSLFVIIIIAIGLGVPLLLALSGIIYVIVRRYKQRNRPARFTDSE